MARIQKKHNDSKTNKQASFQEDSSLVLVVDDDLEICHIIKSALSRVGFEVDSAEKASVALELFKKKEYDVVISDLKMPEMNGIELVSILKKQSPSLGSILMTGYGTEETLIDAFTRGKINYYLSKPFALEDLLETVAAASRERKLHLGAEAFRKRMEEEIKKAVTEVEQKNILLENKNIEAEKLNLTLQKSQSEIKETKEYLENLIESSPDAIISTDQNLKISLFNNGAEKMFYGKGSSFLGKGLNTIFAEKWKGLDQIKKFSKSDIQLTRFEIELAKSSGEEFFCDISISKVYSKNKQEGLLLIIKDITEQKRLEEELRASNIVLERLSVTDGPTKLYNHRYFQECLTSEFERAVRYDATLGMIMIDLDDFKLVNDNFGHMVGDKALAITAELIRGSIRNVDTPARYGGEEFAVVLPQAHIADTILVANRIKDSIENYDWADKLKVNARITASIGVSAFPESGAEVPDELVKLADQALYRAKQIGKNRVVIGKKDSLEAIGGGENLSENEKNEILRHISQTLRSTLRLEEVLEYFLKQATAVLGKGIGDNIPCSIMLLDENQQLVNQLEAHLNPERQANFIEVARIAMENRDRQIFSDDKKYGTISAFPINIITREGFEEIIGVLSIGVVPPDMNFFQELVNQTSLGIRNATLYYEMEISKKNLEKKVNELTFLSLMGLTLQHNAQTLENYENENRRLIARCVVQIGFERVIHLDYDPDTKVLSNANDNSLRGIVKMDPISISKLDPSGTLLKQFTSFEKLENFKIISLDSKDIGKKDRKILKKMGITTGEIVIAHTSKKGQAKGIILAMREKIPLGDVETLSTFALHAGLMMDHLTLSRGYRDKTNRLNMLYDIGLNLGTANNEAAWSTAAQVALDKLSSVLKVEEISLYSYLPGNKKLKLLAFSSARKDNSKKPVEETSIEKSVIMGQILKSSNQDRMNDPVIIKDISDVMSRKSRSHYTTNSYMGVPLMAGGDIMGIMNITDKLDGAEFDNEDIEIAHTAASMLAPVLYQHKTLNQMEQQTINILSKIINKVESLSGKEIKGHSERVSLLAVSLAETMNIPREEFTDIKRVGLLHDLGKAVLNKDEIKNHPQTETDILEGYSDNIKLALLTHHHRMDGEGNISEHSGQDIPLISRIIFVADEFDHKYLSKPSSKRDNLTSVMEDLLLRTGTEFDSDVVEALLFGLANMKIKISRRPIGAGLNFKKQIIRHLSAPAAAKGKKSGLGQRRRLRIIKLLSKQVN